MKINLELREDECLITFYLNELKGPKDFVKVLNIIELVAGDFDVDPEMTEKDIGMLVEESKKGGHTDFTVEVTEDGVEAIA